MAERDVDQRGQLGLGFEAARVEQQPAAHQVAAHHKGFGPFLRQAPFGEFGGHMQHQLVFEDAAKRVAVEQKPVSAKQRF